MHNRLGFQVSSVRLLLLPCSAALMALALSGCATKAKPIPEPEPVQKPKEIRKELPVVKFESSKSSKQIAECIVDKWQYIPSAGQLTSRQTAKGYTVIQNANSVGAPVFAAEVNDIPAGTESIFKAYPPFGNSASDYQDAVKECQ